MRSLTWDQVRARRLARNHLLDPAPRERLVDVVRDVCGLQAQVGAAAELAIAARVAAEHPEVGAQERATYRAVLLDEYQDTGHAQRVLLRALFGAPAGRDAPAVTAVGDPCQSIYGWRGAGAGNLPRFRTDFPGPDGAPADEYRLLTSFRNPPEVLTLANAVSAPLRSAPEAVGVGALQAGPDARAGDVRVALLPDVAAELDDLLARPSQPVLLELDELGFLDSTGVSVLVRIANHFDQVRTPSATEPVRRVIEVLGLAPRLGLGGA
jgi:hypothetical protein